MRRSVRAGLWSAAALAVAAALVPAARAFSAGEVTAQFVLASDWGTGYEGHYTIINGSSAAITSWRLEFDLPSGGSISSFWDADMTHSGNHYVAVNKSYNGTVNAGASVTWGYIGAGPKPPINCTINGAPCGGGAGPSPTPSATASPSPSASASPTGSPDTQAPSVPANLRVTGKSSTTISLAWDAATDNRGVTGYDVFRGGTRVTTVTSTSYTDPNLSPSTTFTYTVKARDAAGNVSAASNAVSATTDPAGSGGNRKVAYFTQWGIYARNFFVKTVDTSGQAAKLTNLHYAFGNVNDQGRCFEANATGVGDAWADYQRRFDASQTVTGVADTFNQPLAGNFNQIKQLKAKYPSLRASFSLGGWTWSKNFSTAALPANRAAFVSSCIDMFIKGNLPLIGGEPQGGPGSAAGVFDGIDIDWEWPASEGNAGNVIRAEDKVNLTALLAEFRSQLDAYGATVGRHFDLSIFLPADPAKIDAGFEANKIFQYLDYATVQGYDLHGAWENQTNHQSNLFSPAGDPAPVKFSVDGAISAWISRGAPAAKLVMGVPAFGRGWQGVPATNNGLWQTSTGAAPGTFEAGIEDYKVLKGRAGNRFRDSTNLAFWLYDGSQFWSYDDPTLIQSKGSYARNRGLGGLMMWSLDGDDGTLVAAMATGLGG
jgi:chitinase